MKLFTLRMSRLSKLGPLEVSLVKLPTPVILRIQ
jgi:hypothetical protein